jgi:hypothetical protein
MTAWGLEAEIQGRWSSGRLVRVSHGFSHARMGTGGEPSNSPAHLTKAAFASPLFGPLRAAVELRSEGGRRTVRDVRTGRAFLLNVDLRVEDVLPGFDGWLAVSNLFDAEFVVPGGFEHAQAVIPQVGTDLEIGVAYRF